MEMETPLLPPKFDMSAGTAAGTCFDHLRSPRPAGSAGSEGVRPMAHASAVKLQKVYRSYRTRRRLADSAVVVEELWWQAIDFARLNRSTISFFNYLKPESVTSRWNRVISNAAKIGRGAIKDDNALKLAFQHWIEAIDPRHRYGHNLHFYYEDWCKSDAGQPFFFWLDVGEGRDIELRECPRSTLREQCIIYLGPQERANYEYVIREGKLAHRHTGELLDTTKGPPKSKWIFVMSTSKILYAGVKRKGRFHHSSFLAGGATVAAGRFVAESGVVKAIWAYSGHYRPSKENMNNFLSFLKDNGIDIDEDQIRASPDEDYNEDTNPAQEEPAVEVRRSVSRPPQLQIPEGKIYKLRLLSTVPNDALSHTREAAVQINVAGEGDERASSGRSPLSGGIQSPRADVPRNSILRRINSKKEARSYQLGHQLSLKWTTGAGPRIGCIADYPSELRAQALEFVHLSPRVPPTPCSQRSSPHDLIFNGFLSPPGLQHCNSSDPNGLLPAPGVQQYSPPNPFAFLSPSGLQGSGPSPNGLPSPPSLQHAGPPDAASPVDV